MKEQTNVAARAFEDIPNDNNKPIDVPLSSALQYKSSSMKREEEKLKSVDPKKAAQLERLGMGFGNRS